MIAGMIFVKTSIPLRIAPLLTYIPVIVAAALVLLVSRRALSHLDTSWDTLSYHLPFIARRMGFITLDQYQMAGPLEAYYSGFPALIDYGRGVLWWAFGRPEATNLFNLICLGVLALYANRAFKIEVSWVLIGLFSIPIVQVAVSTSYVDVASNATLTILVLSICDLWINPEKFTRPAPWAVLVAAAAAAANFKLQIGVVACLALPFAIPPTFRLLQEKRPNGLTIALISALTIVGLGLIGFNFLKNLFLYSNPLFPVSFSIGSWSFPGPLSSGSWDSPEYLKDAPRPLRWLLSIVEYRSLGTRAIPYTNGMGDVPLTNPGARMGGFFAALVVFSITALVGAVILRRDRMPRIFLIAFATMSLSMSFIPGAHETRYFMVWMMFLVITALAVLRAPGLEDFRTSYKIALIGSLFFVTSITGGLYFTNQGSTAAELVNSVSRPLLNRFVERGDTICLDEWDPVTFLFAPVFHPDLEAARPYKVKQHNCEGYKSIPRN